jgi:hypothetical protein
VLQARPGQAKEIEILVLLQRRNPRPRLRWTSAPRQATPPPRAGASIHALRWDRLGALVHDYLQSYEVTQFSAPTVLRGSLTFVEQDFAPRCNRGARPAPTTSSPLFGRPRQHRGGVRASTDVDECKVLVRL